MKTAYIRALVMIGSLVGLVTPSLADRVPDPLGPAAWTGSWLLTATATYSTCEGANVGDTHLHDLTVSITKGQLVGRSRSRSSGTATNFKIFGQRQMPPIQSFRSGTDVGMDLQITAPGSLVGKKIIGARATSRNTCVVIYEIVGTNSGLQPKTVSAPKPAGALASRSALGSVEDLDVTSLTSSEVLKDIQSKYLVGIKRCHERAMKVDPRSEGRVTIRFKVDASGAVATGSVKGYDVSLDGCIEAQTTIWTFDPPKKNGKPTTADFVLPLLLKPGN